MALSPDQYELVNESRLIEEIYRLRNRLHDVGICPDCEAEITHYMIEPFACCRCSGVDYEMTTIPVLQKLRYDLGTSTLLVGKLADRIRELGGG